MKLLDAKLQNPNEVQETNPLQMLQNYFLSRYSSVIRIPVNALAAGKIIMTSFNNCNNCSQNSNIIGAGGAFFGMAKALYKDLPKGPSFRGYGIRAFGMGLLYFTTNEIANGIVRRSLDREQLFYSNSVAGVVTNVATFAYLKTTYQTGFLNTFLKSIKYSWSLCVAAIAWDIYIVQMRHYFLIHGIQTDKKKEIFKINRVPSEGTRWLRMKQIEKLREDANMERYGTTKATNVIFTTKDDTMTFDEVKEQIQRHKEYLETQNMLSESTPNTSIFSKSTTTTTSPSSTNSHSTPQTQNSPTTETSKPNEQQNKNSK